MGPTDFLLLMATRKARSSGDECHRAKIQAGKESGQRIFRFRQLRRDWFRLTAASSRPPRMLIERHKQELDPIERKLTQLKKRKTAIMDHMVN